MTSTVRVASSSGRAAIETLEARELLAADIVLEWNQHLLDALRVDRTSPGPGWASRNAAIVQAAVFDALNGVDHQFTPFQVTKPAKDGTDSRAAVAEAAFEALSSLYPDQLATFKAELAQDLAATPDGKGQHQGVEYGKFVADQILAGRAGDGSKADQRKSKYTPGGPPGQYQLTPPGNLPAWGAVWGDVTPFAIQSSDQFSVPPVPALNSPEYTAAFNDVKSMGSADSISGAHKVIADFWAYDRASMGTPIVLYNTILQTLAVQQHNSTDETARLLALANVAMADSGIAAWDVKYRDNFWRPVTGIRQADTDGNPDTTADPTWTPYGAPADNDPSDANRFTPPFPSYVSGHATFGGALFEVLKDFYGTDNITFSATSNDKGGSTRTFHSFSAAAEENGLSRVYMGVHWQFDNLEGQALGRQIGDYVIGNVMKPVS